MNFLLAGSVLLVSIVVHEVAHAWQARREGDDTAEKLGRITLNPIPHLDLFGSIIVPLSLFAMGTLSGGGGFLFGWAKPVPVNPARYRDYVKGDIRVSLAGIVSNLILAVVATLLTAVVVKLASMGIGPVALMDAVYLGLQYALYINLLLAFFNLIPIPPLDGSHVVAHLLPPDARNSYRQVGQYGILLLMGLLYLVPGAFSVILWPVLYLRGLADWFVRLWI
jgi:Zn-dependent protease